MIRGTRVPVRGLAKQIDAGESLEVLRQGYDEDAFEFAVQWAKANPRRGRPSTRQALVGGGRARGPARRSSGDGVSDRWRVKLWADACATPTLEGVAHARGYEATSDRRRGLRTALDRSSTRRSSPRTRC